jgi:hypothetical protein
MRQALIAVLALVALLGIAPAMADGELDALLSDSDKDRLANFELTRAAAIKEAKTGGAAEDVAILEQVLAGTPATVRSGFNPNGAWKCRTLKLGGQLPLTIYPPFQCRISEDGIGWRLEKTTGSQRVSGHFYDDTENRLVFVGAGHYANEKPKAYGEDPERNEVAYAFNVEGGRLRLEFPAPQFESRFDILELSR